MNHIPDSKRARITAIIARVISELAGGDPNHDQAVALAVRDVIYACYQSQVPGDPRAAIDDAMDLTTEKDWLFTVKKLGGSFEFESRVRFRDESPLNFGSHCRRLLRRCPPEPNLTEGP